MKKSYIRILVAMFLGSATITRGATISEGIVERGPHHSVHETVVEMVEDGQARLKTNRFTVLNPGGNYYSETEKAWVEASDEIELAQEGAIYRKGQFKVKFPADQVTGPIELTLPDGRMVKTQTIGVAITDPDSTDSLWLGQVKGSAGLLVGRNEIVYPDAFEGIRGDLRLKISGSQFTSDTHLKERPPEFEAVGFGENSRLEIWHRVFEAPAPEVRTVGLQRPGGRVDADQQLRWGELMMGKDLLF